MNDSKTAMVRRRYKFGSRSAEDLLTRAAALALLALWAMACSSTDTTELIGAISGEPWEHEDALGQVALELRLGDDVSISRLSWQIEGNGHSDGGELEVGRRSLVSARLGGIPVGEGYTLRLSSIAADTAQLRCSGTASFAVRRASTTAVRVEVRCLLTAQTGQVTLTAPINVCPLITALSASPLELEVGDTARLWLAAEDRDQGPSRLSVTWQTDRGTLVSKDREASLTCGTVGQAIVRVVASDGSCEGTASLGLQCLAVQQPRNEIAWPGAAEVRTLDPVSTFAGNMSGAAYVPGEPGTRGTLWLVQNGPSMIYPLFPDADGGFSLAAEGPWSAGKRLTYPNGSGEPDAEGVAFAAATDAAYVATERNNAANGTSRLSILRFELETEGAVLAASHEWNVTAQLPRVDANAGLEGISWISDDFLVARGFFDERAAALYDPAAYPAHAGGLFLVAVEADGMVYAFALNHDSLEATLVASFSSGHPQVMDLEFDRSTGQLWAACDNGCQGEMTVLGVAPQNAERPGRFRVLKTVSRPPALPNINNEGLAIAPGSECNMGLKPIYWVDDSSTGGHALRGGRVPCAPLD